MKRFFFTLSVLLMTLVANAKVDVDFSSRFEEGTNTIQAASAWGWFSVDLRTYDVMSYEYLYIKYESSCNFNLILQDPDWQNAYQVSCNSSQNEAYIQLKPGAFSNYSCIVLQNHSEGSITINKCYFCTEEEFYNPAPSDPAEARENLIEIFLRYQKFQGTLPIGDGYGCYAQAPYDKLCQALEAVNILDTSAGDALTAEQINAMAQAIVDAYRELMASKKVYLPENGYYRFVCARQFYSTDEESEQTTYYTKAMYSDAKGENKWKTVDNEDPSFLWTLQRQNDDTYLLTNASNQFVFSSPEKSTEETKYIVFDAINKADGEYAFSWPMCTEEDVVVFNFRFSDQPANDQKYIHCNWHDGGKGWGGPLTTWYNTSTDSGASEWFIEPVSDEEAQRLLNDNSFAHDFVVMLEDAKAKTAIANDQFRTKLITEPSQFSSPFSQNDLGSTDGGNLSEGVLIDGKTNTYWHSVWSAGDVEMGTHYLQIELPEEVDGDIQFDFSRREISSDHVTQWGIYGSDSPDGEKYDYEWIADIDAPYNNQGESLSYTFNIENGKQYQYLRFYAEKTTGNKGFFHLSEMQLYSLEDNPTNQAAAMGQVYTDLMSAIQEAEKVDQGAISKSDYEALKAAYEPFIAAFIDPTELREAIDAAEMQMRRFDVGDNPGQWNADIVEAFQSNIEAAKNYDKAGQYTQQQTDNFIASLSTEQIAAQANGVSPDKYYTIRFASEEKYEEQGWGTGNVLNSEFGPLYDTYLCPAEEETHSSSDASSLRPGSPLFFTNDACAEIAFRFVPVSEGKYIIQHKASGLYIHCYGYNSWTSLSLDPTIFTVEAAGYGENIIRGIDYQGNDMACLHAQLAEHRLVTWHDDFAGCNSGLILEELTDETGDAAMPKLDFRPGELTTMCYPVAIAPEQGMMYTVAGSYTNNEKTYVALNKVQHANAGQPVVFAAPGTFNEGDDESRTIVSFAVAAPIVTAPQNSGALKGVYADLDLESAAIIFAGNQCMMSTEETSKVYAHQAYVDPSVAADAAGTYDVVLEVGSSFDGIQQALNSVARPAGLYNAAGQLIRSKATIADIESLPSGLYILGGTKIWVKH